MLAEIGHAIHAWRSGRFYGDEAPLTAREMLTWRVRQGIQGCGADDQDLGSTAKAYLKSARYKLDCTAIANPSRRQGYILAPHLRINAL